MNSGIYQIINILNGKMYIGSSVNIEKRWLEHKRALKGEKHHSILLQRAWNKSSCTSFIINIIERVTDKTQLTSIEQHYKDLYDSYNPKYGYDICKIAGYGSQLGLKRSKKTKNKLRKKVLGNKRALGSKRSDEIRQQLCENHYDCSGKNNPMYGRRGELSPHFGKPRSEETKAKISTSNTGKHRSEVTKQKLRELAKKQWKLKGKFASS